MKLSTHFEYFQYDFKFFPFCCSFLNFQLFYQSIIHFFYRLRGCCKKKLVNLVRRPFKLPLQKFFFCLAALCCHQLPIKCCWKPKFPMFNSYVSDAYRKYKLCPKPQKKSGTQSCSNMDIRVESNHLAQPLNRASSSQPLFKYLYY